MTITSKITNWIKSYAETSSKTTLVVGISGGIDSALVSTLCAETGLKTIALSLPLHQKQNLHDLSIKQGNWLINKYKNVVHRTIDLTPSYDSFVQLFSADEISNLSLANTKSRLRMVALYQIAANNNGIVVGTGNKVEDFGVGFFTKYGDGGVDISPIADLYKTEVWEMSKILGVPKEIIDAPPTDGLWEDNRTDEQQLGMTYSKLEWAMQNADRQDLQEEEKLLVDQYKKLHNANLHKMLPIPVCKLK
jgi:NAD+ synthase